MDEQRDIAERLRRLALGERGFEDFTIALVEAAEEAADEIERLRKREREAFEAGWNAARTPVPDDIMWLPIGTIKVRLFEAYLAHAERKEH